MFMQESLITRQLSFHVLETPNLCLSSLASLYSLFYAVILKVWLLTVLMNERLGFGYEGIAALLAGRHSCVTVKASLWEK